MCSTFSSTSYRFVLNRIVTFRKWICTIATASSQNNITYDMITANEFLLLQKFRNRMLTMHIAQILVRFGGFFPQAAGALRYFPENALHEYHKEVSNNTAMYTSTSCSRSPAPCRSSTSDPRHPPGNLTPRCRLLRQERAPSYINRPSSLCSCSTALLLARVFVALWPAEKRQKTPGVANGIQRP